MVEQVVVAEARAAVNADEGCDAGSEISIDTVVSLKGLLGCGVGEWGEAFVGAFEGSCGHC